MSVTAHDFFRLGSGVVTLCGSTKFFFEAMEANRILTFNNWIVLLCGSWGHSFHKYSEDLNRDYSEVKKLHFQKILMSRAIVVVSDASGYIGTSTKAEILFANSRDIPVFYFDGINFKGNAFKIPNDLHDTSIIDNFAQLNGGLGF